jgi:DNA sulfur modification protein DndD
MLLRSIKLKNFRQYSGEQLITFSCDSHRNVTVILGDNTSGKTTLVQAFNWALYGIAAFTTKDFLLNMDVARDLALNELALVEVEICLMHDNVDYIITRTQKYICSAKGVDPLQSNVKVSYRQPDGQTETIRAVAVESTISKILPKDLSGYFFFDGERIGNISNKQDVTEAVKSLLGLSVLDNAMRHLNPNVKASVVGKLKSSMDIEGNQKAAEALECMNREMERKLAINQKHENIKKEIGHYEARKQQLGEILREEQSTAMDQRRKDDLDSIIKSETKFYEEASKRMIQDFNTHAVAFFSQPLMRSAITLLQSINMADKGVEGMNASAIHFLIQRGYCLCGSEIQEGNDAHRHLLHELDFLPPQAIGTLIRNYLKDMRFYESQAKSFYENIQSRYEDMYRYKTRIQDSEEELEEVSSRIQGKANAVKYEQELIDIRERLKRFYEEKDKAVKESGACDNELERCKKLYASNVTASEKNKQIMEVIQYAENIYDWIRSSYSARELDLKEKLENKVNAIFKKMYHGQRKVVIDERYRVSLLTAYSDEDVKTDESRGLETVKNFAFIAGLVDLAREKITGGAGENEVELSSEPYPLVMDAPFSNADEIHVRNISKILPDIAEQVIMVVMSKDWSYAEKVMSDKVGKRYILTKESETLTHVKELNG